MDQPQHEQDPSPASAPSPPGPPDAGLAETLQRAGLDPYTPTDRVQILDTSSTDGSAVLREMTAAEEQRYGDEHVYTRWEADTGEVTSWIEPPPNIDAADDRVGDGAGGVDGDADAVEVTLSRLEQRAGRMTRGQAAAALQRHQRHQPDRNDVGSAQVIEDDAAAARVAAIDHGWSVDELLSESDPATG